LKCRWCGKQFKNPPSQVGGIKNAGRFCSHYCAGKLCNTVYTKKIIKKKFKRIKSKSKFNTCWLRDNHQYLLNATRRRYGKNSWYKFLQNINEIDKMRRNYINPKYKRIARAFLKYWTGNQDNLEWERPIAKIGKRFNWSNTWGLPIDGYEALDTRALYPSIEYLIKVKAIRLLKRGGGNEKGRIGDQRHRPNQYILLKTRI